MNEIKSLNEMEPFLPAILDGEDKTSHFKNRIRKTYRHLRKWAKRTKTDCFRVLTEKSLNILSQLIFMQEGFVCIIFCAQEKMESPLQN